ncbi:MAG: ribonuclease P protein component [Eubacteriales bacterium]|nr:ribonuclease P protein component [Eubacteriales bacterium]
MNRTYSLKRHKEFHFTYRVGKKVSCKPFTLVYARNRLDKMQVGFSVSKKIGNSVERNRCKRRLRACFSCFLPRVKKGYNLIFVARSESLEEQFELLKNDMKTLLERAGLLEDRI